MEFQWLKGEIATLCHVSEPKKTGRAREYIFKPGESELMTDPKFAKFAQQAMDGGCPVDPETGDGPDGKYPGRRSNTSGRMSL